MEKIVVLTGSFNPISKAHSNLLNKAVYYFNADKGLFVITNQSYLISKMVVNKSNPNSFILSEEFRKEMIDSLNEEFPKLFFGGVELGDESPSTERTIRSICKKNPNSEIYFLIGADKLRGVSRWNSVDRLLSKVHLCYFPRNDIDTDSIIANSDKLTTYKDRIHKLDGIEAISDISSTKIRDLFFSRKDYSALMNEGPYKILSKYSPSDFKDLTEDEILKYTVMYGGRFSGNMARKRVYDYNTKIFSKMGISDIVANTKVYNKEFSVNSSNNYETKFDCVNDLCSNVAKEMLEKGLKPAILNLASRVKPCGGYQDGANAQEESLCYQSTLSQSLLQFGNPRLKYVKEYQGPNVSDVYPLDLNFGGIYSKNITFFRENIDNYYALSKSQFSCDIISVASLANQGYHEFSDDESKYFNNDGSLNEEGIKIEKNKIRTIYRIALVNNNDSLVLGAFGCGVYHMLPSEVSKLFKDVLNENEFKNKFKNITFAIYEGKGSSRKIVGRNGKFKAFYDVFAKH